MGSVAGSWEQHMGMLAFQEDGWVNGRLPRCFSLAEPWSFGPDCHQGWGHPVRSECLSRLNYYGFIINGDSALCCVFFQGKDVLI